MSRITCHAWLVLLGLFGPASAMQNLPLSIPAHLANSVLAQEMTALIQDYSLRLLHIRLRHWTDQETFIFRKWSPHFAAFETACNREPGLCAQIVRAELKALRTDLSADEGAISELAGAEWSFIFDLCEAAWPQLPFDDLIFNLCGGQNRTAQYATLIWAKLGYEKLLIAYYEADVAYQSYSKIGLTESSAKQTAKADEQRLSTLGNQWISAIYFGAKDNLDSEYTAWTRFLLDANEKNQFTSALMASINLARISFKLGNLEQASKWKLAAEEIAIAHLDLPPTMRCLLDSEEARADLAFAHATGTAVDIELMIKKLIQRDCAFTQLTLEYAVASLRTAEPARIATPIQLAINACENSQRCAQSRIQQLKDLLVIAEDRVSELLLLSTRFLADSQIGTFDAIERQIAWSLATILEHHPEGFADAYKLYNAVDEQIYRERSSLVGSNQLRLQSLGRYDELSRQRVKLAAQEGEAVWFNITESLRAQSIARRLRVKRWELEFKGIRDDAARSKLQAAQVTSAAIRNSINTFYDKLRDQPYLVAAVQASIELQVSSYEDFVLDAYFAALASRKSEALYGIKRDAWMNMGPSDLWSHENMNKTINRYESLQMNEAYMSWLRVPGGYVGTLAAPDPQYAGSWISHKLVSRFISVPDSKKSELALYRKLITYGAGAPISTKFIPDSQPDIRGLVLEGAPIWRQPDKSIVSSFQPTPGSVRVNSLSELSDELFELLLTPFQADLKFAKRLTISPDGDLVYLPFETLTNAGAPVLDNLDFSYSHSFAVHEELWRRAHASRPADRTLLTFADPDYLMTTKTILSTSSVPPALESIKWKQLPGTRIESNELMKIFPDALQRLSSQASLKELRKLERSGELKRYRILHFATHGYVDDDRSALVLSMTDGLMYGYLTDTDILDLHLNSDLVILSACNTGLGRNVTGEGVVGLPYAFLLAGNSNTVISLWPVNDKGTAAFMSAFMKSIQDGLDFLVALNKTKREFARGDHGHMYMDPRVWAAFIQYGTSMALH